MRWTQKNIWKILWLGFICIVAVVMNNAVTAVIGADNSLEEKIEKNIFLGSLDFFYPVMVYPQHGNEETFFEKLVQKAGYQMFPLAQYISEEGERSLYATQMENELSAEIEEILAKEAADENHVDENGEVVKSEGAVEENETLIAEHVLEQFAKENEAAQADSSNVISENLQTNNEVTGQEYPVEMLSYDFLINNFYTVDSTTNITESQLNAAELLSKDMTMKNDNSKPQILIYHTHSQEDFADSVAGDSSTTVVGVGERLTQILREKYGYNVIHSTKAYDIIDGQLDRNKAYSMALVDIEKILEENPTIEVVIDLHRDSINGKKLLGEVDGKPVAKFMFFNGMSYTNKNGAIGYLENPNIEDNLAFSLQLQLAAAKYYPGCTRKIYLKGYRYNLHVRPKSLLIEAGAQNNTLEEEMNAMEVLADVLNKVLSGE